MIKVKICGITSQDMADIATSEGADYIGCVFVEASPRYITPQNAGKLNISATKIAVTSNADDDLLQDIITHFQPDYIQLHGSENAERAVEIATKYNIRTIKAFAISADSDFDDITKFPANMYLFDTPKPQQSNIAGGNGISFDWSLLTQYKGSTPYFLSGGLDANNVLEAVSITNAKYIDVSSGVEARKGVKDASKIKNFLQAVNGI